MSISMPISLIPSGRSAEIPKQIVPPQAKQSKVKPVDAKAKAYVEQLLRDGKIKLEFFVPKHVNVPSLTLAVKDSLVQLAATEQGRRILDDALAWGRVDIVVDDRETGSYSSHRLTLGYKFFLEQAYIVNGQSVFPSSGVFALAHELAHAAVDSKQLRYNHSQHEVYAVTETDKFVKEYNEKWGTKYPMRERYAVAKVVFVGNGDLFSGSTVADSEPKAVAARYKEIEAVGLSLTIQEQLDRLEALFMYKFQNSVANASTPKELQAKAALVKLQKLVNELSAKETELIAKETMGKLTPQEVTSALAEYGVHRADFLKALK